MKRTSTLILSLALIGCGELEGNPEGDLAAESAGDDEAAGDVEVMVSALTGPQRCNEIATRRSNSTPSLDWLGSPLTACVGDTGGAHVGYEHGSIYFGDTVGAHVVTGLILSRYVALGGPSSFLKFPTTDEESTSFNSGRYNGFEGGDILWKNGASAAWEVHGCIRDKWGGVGWETSLLGFPTSNQITWTISDGGFPIPKITTWRRGEFEFGKVYFRNDWNGNCNAKTWPVLSALNPNPKFIQLGYPQISANYTSPDGASGSAKVRVSGSGFTPGATVFISTGTTGSKCPAITTTVPPEGSFINLTSAQRMSVGCMARVNNHVTVEAYDTGGKVATTRFFFPFPQ